MQRYRLYFFVEGQIAGRPREFTAASDEVAVALAEKLREGRAAELWFLSERIKDFDGPPGRPE